MAEGEQKARSIADAALALEGEMRDLFITSACGENAGLIAEVRALVEAGPEDIASAQTIAPVAKPPTSFGETHPSKIAHFTIRRVIGSGGMGTVYEGLQDNPRRKVAIKVMRSGVTSRTAQRRFAFESQVLARLHHQGIAQIYEAGTWDDGSGGVPWFAMEYIVGSKELNDYANAKNMGTRDRLKLFSKVCDAVSHGHQKGIIHRDLKPGNILVDTNGQPKVIDFGVARATDSDMAVTTLQTDVGQLLGTVQYMSPEQCEADPDLLDTRSDVYSLGVILYELLCDALPYDLESVPVFEAARVIREQAPGRPSTIDRTLRGDVETIVMKALQKDRDHRYQSAHELQRDIQRYLDNEPIEARPPSITYQLKIFAKRNRAVFVSITSIAAVLVIATIVSIGLAISAKQSEAAAEAAREEATASAQRAEALRDEALESFNMLLMTSELTEDLLALGAPRNAQGRTMSVHDIALRATEEITERFSDIPHLEAPARRAIGMLLWEMGDLKNAETQLVRSIEVFNGLDTNARALEHIQTAVALCKVLRDKGDYDRAREQAQAILDLPYAEIIGHDSEEMLGARAILGDIATLTLKGDFVQLRREVMAGVETGGKVSREFELGAQVDLAEALFYKHLFSGDEERAQAQYLQEATDLIETANQAAEVELGHMHPITIQARGSMINLAFHESMETLDFDGIKPSFQQLLDDCRNVFGPDHVKTAAAATSLGFIHVYTSNENEYAKQLLTEALEIYEKLGGTGPGVAAAEEYLGIVYMREGRLVEAEALLRKSVDTYEELYGEETMSVVNLKAALAMALLSQGKFEEGEPLWEYIVDMLSTGEAGSSAAQGVFRMRMGRAYAYIGFQQDGVDEVIQELIDDMVEANGPGDPVTLNTAMGLCRTYYFGGGGWQAIEILESLLKQARPALPPTDTTLLTAELVLAEGYLESGQYEQADELIERLIPMTIEAFGDWDRNAIKVQAMKTRNLEYQGRIDEAIIHAADLHERLSGELGAGDEQTVKAEAMLNSLLVDAERWNDVDAIMAARRARWQHDPDELVAFAEMIIHNGSEPYKERYLDLALDSARRAVAILGEDEPETTFTLANVHLARGEHAEAARWLETTIFNAGEKHEDIETYQETLGGVHELMTTTRESAETP